MAAFTSIQNDVTMHTSLHTSLFRNRGSTTESYKTSTNHPCITLSVLVLNILCMTYTAILGEEAPSVTVREPRSCDTGKISVNKSVPVSKLWTSLIDNPLDGNSCEKILPFHIFFLFSVFNETFVINRYFTRIVFSIALIDEITYYVMRRIYNTNLWFSYASITLKYNGKYNFIGIYW